MGTIRRARTALILLAAALPGAAGAQAYVTGKIGFASADLHLDEPYNGVIDDSAVAYGVNAGLGFGPRLAVELGAHRYGGFDGRATPCPAGLVCAQVVRPISGNDITTYTLSIVPRFTLGSVELFGRAGYYRADIDTEIVLGEDEFTERGLVLGAGARWYFREPWSVSLQASRFDDNLRQYAVGVGWGIRPFRD